MKQIRKNDFVISLLKGAVGPDVDVSTFPVWEVAATSNVPLRGKQGTIFENAVIQSTTLFQLAAAINHEPLPVMIDHDMSGAPKGKFFYAEVLPNDFGYQELRGYQYVNPIEDKLVATVDNGTYDEVSIAFAAQKMTCNKCGWDYKASFDSDNMIPFFTRTCENGHTIGKDGTHLELWGVEDTLELSLVSRGAAKNSKIIGQSESKLGKHFERLAAHGLDINSLYVTATASKGIEDMADINFSDLVVQLADAKSKAAVAENDRSRLERELAEAVGARNEAETRVTELESELRTARATAEEAPSAEEREQARTDSEAAKAAADFLKGQYIAVKAAAGETDVEAPDNVAELIAGIEKHVPELSKILPVGGLTEASGAANEQKGEQDFSVFRARHNTNR